MTPTQCDSPYALFGRDSPPMNAHSKNLCWLVNDNQYVLLYLYRSEHRLTDEHGWHRHWPADADPHTRRQLTHGHSMARHRLTHGHSVARRWVTDVYPLIQCWLHNDHALSRCGRLKAHSQHSISEMQRTSAHG